MKKFIAVLLAIFISSPLARAAERHPIPCWEVRSYVAIFGEARALEWAIQHGYTAHQIAALRARCGR